MAETNLGWYMPIKNCRREKVNGKCIWHCNIGMSVASQLQLHFKYILIIFSGQPRIEKKFEPMLTGRKIHECYCETELSRQYTKSKKEMDKNINYGGNCILSEYMDSISRTGADLLEERNKSPWNISKITGMSIWRQSDIPFFFQPKNES